MITRLPKIANVVTLLTRTDVGKPADYNTQTQMKNIEELEQRTQSCELADAEILAALLADNPCRKVEHLKEALLQATLTAAWETQIAGRN